VDVDGDAAAVVPDRDRAVDMDGHIDPLAVPGQMLVDRVVEDLRDAVVEGSFIGAADVHSGLFSDGLQALEFAQF